MTAGNELCVWLKVVGGDPRGDWVEKEEPSGKRRFGPRLPSLLSTTTYDDRTRNKSPAAAPERPFEIVLHVHERSYQA